MSGDVLRLRNMRFFAHHGLFPEETTLGQQYEVDLELIRDLSVAGMTDDVEQTLNYPEVYDLVARTMTAKRFKLVEAIAEHIARDIGERYAPIDLVIRVRKPNPPVNAHFDGVEVEIRRSYG